MSQLVTGDAVLLDLRPARLPTRMLATAIDLVIVFGASYLWGYVVQESAIYSPARWQATTIAGFILINFGYLIAMETLTRGRTVGDLALGLRVVRDDGGAIRFRQALLRGLAFWTIDFALWTGFCGGLICAAVNPQGKRFGDLMAGTIVIRTRAPKPPTPLPPVPEELRLWSSQLELSSLPDELVTAARQLIQRRPAMNAHPREQLTVDLARQIAARTAPAPPPGLAPADFLTAVVAERRRRETERLTHAQWVPTAEELPAGWR